MSLPNLGFGSKTNHDQLGGTTYPRYMVMYAERKQTSDSTPNDEDPIFGFRGATTHTTGTEAKVYMGILNGVLPSPEHNITVSNLSAGIVGETDRITVHPGVVLNPTTTTIAPDTKGSMMYDSGSDELKYYDGAWQIVSAGGLSAHALDGVYHTATGLTVGWVISADSATTFSWKAPAGGSDDDAIHDNVANEITAITPKTALVAADEFILEDSGAVFVKKAVTFGNLQSSMSLANLGTRAHSNLSDAPTSAHHVRYADSEVESVITAELVDGQSIDNAIDGLISTHQSGVDAHHPKSHDMDSHSDATLVPGSSDQMIFWDYSDTQYELLSAGTGLSISVNSLNCNITQYTDTLARTACISDVAYGSGWSGVTTIGASKNALYTKINAMDTTHTNHAADDDAHHDLVTVASLGALSLSGQQVTFNFDAHHFRMDTSGTPDVLQLTKAGATDPSTDDVLTWDGTDAIWDAPAGLISHDLTSAYHTDSGLTGGHFLKADTATTFSWQAHGLTEGGAGTDTTAIHDNEANEIGLITVKNSLVAGDVFIIEDFGVSYAKKSAKFSAIESSLNLGNLGTRTHASLSDAPADAHHALVTVTADPLTLSGQAITFNYGSTHFQIGSSNELLIGKDTPANTDVLTWSSTSGAVWSPSTPAAHILATTGPHTGTLPWTDLSKTGSSLADLATRTHASLSDAPTSAHHVRYADSEVEAVITAELVDGQSIDNAIDALINTHNVANRHIDHTTVSITAGAGLTGGGHIGVTRTLNVIGGAGINVNADNIECTITQYTDALAKTACVSDVAYGVGWNAVTTIAPSKNAVYDQLVTHYANANEHHAQSHDMNSHSDASLVDPGADRIVFWDETSNQVEWLVANTGLAISGNNLNCSITQYTDVMATAAADAKITIECGLGQTIDNAIDALILTHKNDEDAHHMEHNDLTDTTMTGIQDEDSAMFGGTNASYVPMMPIPFGTLMDASWAIQPTVTGTQYFYWRLPLPTMRGGLKLYVVGWEIGTQDADANNRIDDVHVYGVVYNANTGLDSYGNTITTITRTPDTWGAAVDCSSYNIVHGRMDIVTATAANLNITYFNLLCYYGT